MTTRVHRRPLTLGAGFVLLLGGCATGSQQGEPASYSEIRDQELDAERAEFIDEKQQELADLNSEIDDMETKVDEASGSVEEDQLASWKVELGDLRQERETIQSDLQRARQASDAEWEQMRGTIATATDSLQAGARKLGAEIAAVFRSDEESEGSGRAEGLCSLGKLGNADPDADVDEEEHGIVVELTTDDQSSVTTLRARAQDLTKQGSYRLNGKAAQEASGRGLGPSVSVKVTSVDIDNGSKITFVPTDGRMQPLQAQLEQDAERIEEGTCE